MAIRNPDGSIYQSGGLQQYNPDKPEHALFDQWDREIIEIGGSPIFYYEVLIQTNTLDPLYLEDRGKLFSPTPTCLYAFYDPTPAQNFQGMFGVDAPDELMFELNFKAVVDTLGHLPLVGSRIFTPHRRENWEIIQRSDEVYKMWGQIRLQIMCKRFQESATNNDGKVTENSPNFSVNNFRR